VEVAGIEPASFGTEPGLLRAQTVSEFSPRRSPRHAGDGSSHCAMSATTPWPSRTVSLLATPASRPEALRGWRLPT